MKRNENQTPTIQVMERMFSLLDVLAAHPDPVSLKMISEQTGLLADHLEEIGRAHV